MKNIQTLTATVLAIALASISGEAAPRCQVVSQPANDVQYFPALQTLDDGIHSRTGNPISPWAMAASNLPLTQSSPAIDVRSTTVHETRSAVQFTIRVSDLSKLVLYPETFARYTIEWKVAGVSYQLQAEATAAGWTFWVIGPDNVPFLHATAGKADPTHSSILLSVSRSFMRNPKVGTVLAGIVVNAQYQVGDRSFGWNTMYDWDPDLKGSYRLGSGC